MESQNRLRIDFRSRQFSRLVRAAGIALFCVLFYSYPFATGWPRFVFFAAGCALSFAPRLGLYLLIFATVGFEAVTLQWNQPNQFIFENAWLGFALATFARSSKWEMRTAFLRMLDHPFALTIWCVAAFTTGKWLVQWSHIKALSFDGISWFKVAKAFVVYIWQWDVVANPFIDIAVVWGWGILLASIVAFLIVSRPRKHFGTDLARAMVLSSAIVHTVSILQRYGILSEIGTFEHGATFQNGNHYSFYSALAFFWCLDRFKNDSNRYMRIVSILLSPVAIYGLVIGGSRSVLLATFGTFGIACAVYLLSIIRGRRTLKLWNLIAALLVPGSIVVIAILLRPLFSQTEINKYAALANLIEDFEWRKFIFLGGRGEHFGFVGQALETLPFTGQGYLNFLTQSGRIYEVHNSFLALILGVGYWIMVPIIYSIIMYLKHLKKMADRPFLLSLLFGSLIFMTMLPDNYLSYHSLLFCAAFSIFPLFSDFPRLQAKTPWLIFLPTAFLLGLLTFLNPHERVSPLTVWRGEPTTFFDGTLQWSAHYQSVTIEPKMCAQFKIKGVAQHGLLDIRYRFLDPATLPSRFAPSSALARVFNGASTITVDNTTWNEVCFCNYGPLTNLGLYTPKGDFMAFVKGDNLGKDGRFVSFGTSQPIAITPSEHTLRCLTDHSSAVP